jgi:hypothetical protein
LTFIGSVGIVNLRLYTRILSMMAHLELLQVTHSEGQVRRTVMDNSQRFISRFTVVASVGLFVLFSWPVHGQPPLNEPTVAESIIKRNHAGPKAFKERVQARRAAAMAMNTGSFQGSAIHGTEREMPPSV